MIEETPRNQHLDYGIVAAMFTLWLFGSAIVYTSSNQLAITKYGDAFYLLKKHLLFSIVGIAVFAFAIRFDIEKLRDSRLNKIPISLLLLGISALLLICVFIPGLGHRAGNAKRWLNLLFIKFQPSEFLKLALCIFYANYITRYNRDIHTLRYGLLIPFGILLPFILLLLLQPDLGTVIMLGLWLCVMLFISGTSYVHLCTSFLSVIALGTLFVLKKGYNIDRVLVYLDPWKDALGKGFQPIHSMYAFSLGGIWGRGPGESLQKLFYLPEAHTDYALSVVAEEFGFLAIVIFMILYGIIIWKGIHLAYSTRDRFRRSLAWGLVSIFSLQVVINMGVVTALLPPKGLTLPFISYGGSSLVFTFAMLGLLVNLSRQKEVGMAAGNLGVRPLTVIK